MVLGMGTSERRVVEERERSKLWEKGEELRREHPDRVGVNAGRRVHREERTEVTGRKSPPFAGRREGWGTLNLSRGVALEEYEQREVTRGGA